MPDYVYLLENRLSADQRHALTQLRNVARDAGTILFLTGDAVRDLTSGHAVRELEVSIHGNALKFKKTIEKLGGAFWGEDELSHSLYLCFPGTVRVNLISTHGVAYPKPGKPVYRFASIQEDLRRRDFTVNAMAISLNEGSYGLLMDPLNGAADVEARVLRLVSNYGFIEDPALLIRVTRYRARLGWEMDMRTQARYDNAKTEGAIEALSTHGRSQELEQIGHEEDGLKVLRALELEGWMKVLFPAWTSAKADETKLAALHEVAVGLQIQGVHPDMSAAQMELLTAKLAPKDLSSLKRSLLRPGFVSEWNDLDAIASDFSKVLLARQNAKPSASYRLFTSYDPEAILWLGFTSKSKEVQERYNQFLRVWPEARQRIPHTLMQEMRITPDLPKYGDIVQAIFLELIDGKLSTPEEMRAWLEPHSPPAPPPPVTVKRVRARRSAEAKLKEQALEEEEEELEESLAGDEDLEVASADDEELDLSALPKGALADEEGGEQESDEEEDREEAEEAAATRGKKQAAPKKGQKAAPAQPVKTAARPEPSRGPAQPAAKNAPKPAAAKPTLPAAPTKAAPAAARLAPAPVKGKTESARAATKPQPKPAAKPSAKSAPKPPAKKAPKPAPAKAPKARSSSSAKARSARPAPAKSAKSAAKKPVKFAKKR
jgi:tRNA nucleotidyltransferase (CCA-adding enzyme)